MLLDKEQNFSLNQAITASAASTNAIQAKGEIAAGGPTPLIVQVVEDFAGLTSLEVQLQTASDSAFTAPDTLFTTPVIPATKLKQGYVIPLSFLPEGNLGFIRLFYKVTGTATAGKLTAGVVAALSQPSNK